MVSERVDSTGTTRDAHLDVTDDDQLEPLPRWARSGALGWLMTLAGIVGFGGSAVLVWERLQLFINPLHRTSCDVNPLVSCGTVMKTEQAALFGFPNPFLGIVGYAMVIAIGVAVLSGARFARWYWLCVWVGVALAGVFLVWLWSQALFVIGVLCIYCMVVWAANIPLFWGLTGALAARGVLPLPEGVRRFLADWAWVLCAVNYVAVIASVLAVFLPQFMAQ